MHAFARSCYDAIGEMSKIVARLIIYFLPKPWAWLFLQILCKVAIKWRGVFMKFNFLAIFLSNLGFIWLPFGNDKISPSFWGTFAHFTLYSLYWAPFSWGPGDFFTLCILSGHAPSISIVFQKNKFVSPTKFFMIWSIMCSVDLLFFFIQRRFEDVYVQTESYISYLSWPCSIGASVYSDL